MQNTEKMGVASYTRAHRALVFAEEKQHPPNSTNDARVRRENSVIYK